MIYGEPLPLLPKPPYCPRLSLSDYLNHTTDNCVTGGYIRTEANTMKQAIDRIAGFIHQHVSPDIENVVSINKSATN